MAPPSTPFDHGAFPREDAMTEHLGAQERRQQAPQRQQQAQGGQAQSQSQQQSQPQGGCVAAARIAAAVPASAPRPPYLDSNAM
jgi:hypothetical protein